MQEGIHLFHRLFVAGTFDGLHAGHREVLSRAFREAEKVTIGLTSDTFVKRYKIFNLKFSPASLREAGRAIFNENFKFQISNFQTRKKKLIELLKRNRWYDRASVIPIDDPYEPASSMRDLDALVVTNDNRARGEEINEVRRSRGLPVLALVEIAIVTAQDGEPISSTRMRNGEIDAEGSLIMPEALRPALGQPLGDMLAGEEVARAVAVLKEAVSRCLVVISVGDMATKTLLDAGIVPYLSIIDGKIGRKPFGGVIKRFPDAPAVKSGPGYISREAVEAIKATIAVKAGPADTQHVIIVDGEEDLLVLPVVIHAPIGAYIYYGQPGKGLVEVKVTTRKKVQAGGLLARFVQ